jgi:toxin-antitoxin system PIN domain toxin
LLDVSVLIALIDPSHVGHDSAHRWFAREGQESWATCPLTENGMVRIVSHPKYPNSPGSPALLLNMLARLRQASGHEFWPDDISLLSAGIDGAQITTPAQITNTYLLALAVAHKGRLATLDRRLSSIAVRGGKAALLVIQET